MRWPDIPGMIIEPGAVATQLADHITAFAVGRPRRMTLDEILVRPTARAL